MRVRANIIAGRYTYGRSSQSAWTPTAPLEVVATADPTAPAAPTYTSATASGATVAHAVKQSPSANARSVRLFRALGFDRVPADAALAATANLSPNQAETLSDTIDLGLYKYWLRAANGSGVLSPEAGPRTALRIQQPGNLAAAPNDLTSASWIRQAVTAALSGTAPDGSAATLLSETTANTSHHVSQIVSGIVSGRRYRFAAALRPNGRSRLAMSLGDGAFGSFAIGVLNLGTGGFASSTSGSLITAPVVTLTRIDADWWLATMEAGIAATSAQMRVSLRNDASATTYPGDTAKGVHAAAATLAEVSA